MATEVQRVDAGPRSQYTDGARQIVKCGMRNIAVVCYRGTIYAIDNACYHHGGPLLRGDIEEMGGHPCIICPWHSYRIALDTGEGLYMGIEVAKGGGKPTQCVKSKGCKQRVHKVVEEAGRVYVLVDLSGPAWESDSYATMALANQEGTMAAPMGLHSTRGVVGGGFELRSGQVFQQLAGRGRNPLTSGVHHQRTPVTPTMPGRENAAHGDADGGPTTKLLVSCGLIEQVCDGVKEFYFTRTSGPLLRHAEYGEYVELELPIPECLPLSKEGSTTSPLGSNCSTASSSVTSTRLMRRKWTICDVNKKGFLFSLLVKDAGGSHPDRSGSAWLHRYALHTPLRVRQFGGTFTFGDHQHEIRAAMGRVLWLTAGIGVTSAYAALISTFGDSFFLEQGKETLHVAHLHVHRDVGSFPKSAEFGHWVTAFPPHSATRPTLSYALRLFITNHSTSSSPSSSATDLPSRKKTKSTSALATSIPTTTGRRLELEDIRGALQSLTNAGTVEEATEDVPPPLVYVCGPPGFVNSCTDALLSLGVPDGNILTDDP